MYAVLLPERSAVVALAVGRLGTGLFVAEPAQPYRSRNPRASPLFQLLETFYDQVKLPLLRRWWKVPRGLYLPHPG